MYSTCHAEVPEPMVMDIINNIIIKAHMQENAAKGEGAFSSFFMLASKLLDLPAHLCIYNVHLVVHDCTVIIIHVHVSGPVDGSKRHIFQLISLAY